MQEILGLGVIVGLLTAGWCIATGGTLLVAFLAYSAGGTASALVCSTLLAAIPRRNGIALPS